MLDSMSCEITPFRCSLRRLSLALTIEKNSVSYFLRNSVTGHVAAVLCTRNHKHKATDHFIISQTWLRQYAGHHILGCCEVSTAS